MARSWTQSQLAAINQHGKTILVSAAAGSGKTSVLTERIIRDLTDQRSPADLSRLLVVTFTRAAAAELKARIAVALTDALSEAPGNRHLSNQLLLLGGADISTIDSFFQRIVRANFEQLGLPSAFRIADENELYPLSSEIMDGLIEEFYCKYAASEQQSEDPLARVRKNSFAEVLDHLLSNRSDGKLTQVLLSYYRRFGSYPKGIELIKESVIELRQAVKLPFFHSRYGIVMRDRMLEQCVLTETELHNINSKLAVDPDIAVKCHALISSDITFFKALHEALDIANYTRVQSVLNAFIVGRFPTVKNKSDLVIRYQNKRAAFRKEIAKWQELFAMPEELIFTQMQKTADFAEMLYELFSMYQKRFMSEKLSRAVLEHNDVRAMLYRLLTDEEGRASEFSKTLSAQYDAVYIDEYQDVDLLQDRIFALIGRNHRFMVGDIKQSIYGFRGSDPSIFSDYRRKMPLYDSDEAEKADGVCVFMSENFRCNRSVIDFTNLVCSFLFSACEKSVGYRPQDDLVCSKADGNVELPVQVAVFDRMGEASNEETENETPADEAMWVASEIACLLKDGKKNDGSAILPSDISILVRNKAHGNAFVSELVRLGIPVSTEVARDLWREPLMTDLLNLLRAVDNPYRDIPLSEFLLSPFGGFSLEELTHIRNASPHHKALYDAIDAAIETCGDSLRNKLSEMFIWLENLREQANLLSADHFLRLLYLDERLIDFSKEPVFLFLYEQARIYQKNAWCGLYGFLAHIEKLLESGAASGSCFARIESAVSVMTVHHSKGLEYPVVFLCACGARFNRSDLSESLMFHPDVGFASKLYNAVSGVAESTLLRDAVAQKIGDEQAEESIRTLYVALTRARERLYITGTLSAKWENAVSSAQQITHGNTGVILGLGSYLSQILAALFQNNQSDASFYRLRHISHEEVMMLEQKASSQKALTETAQPAVQRLDETALHYAKIIREHGRLSYELAPLTGLPTKIAASKMEPRLLDRLCDPTNEKEALLRQIELMKKASSSFASLLTARNQVTAADIGTAAHTFLEHCDYKMLTEYGALKEAERLVHLDFITQQTADILPLEQLERFRKSDLMKQIGKAKQLYRELQFGIFVPLAELTENPQFAESLKDNRLLVQGSIDLLLEMPNGALYLYDYKTDSLSDTERKDRTMLAQAMRIKHEDQLSCYMRAVKQLFGRMPEKAFIYSLPLGEAIEILSSPSN